MNATNTVFNQLISPFIWYKTHVISSVFNVFYAESEVFYTKSEAIVSESEAIYREKGRDLVQKDSYLVRIKEDSVRIELLLSSNLALYPTILLVMV